MSEENIKNYFDYKKVTGENKTLKNKLYMQSIEIKALNSKLTSTDNKYNDLQENIENMIKKAVNEVTILLEKKFNETLNSKNELIESQSKEIDRLKSQINKDSSNSSKPPSSNGLKNIIQNNRVKTGNKPGGKVGHPYNTLELPSNVEELITDGIIEKRIVNHKEDTNIEYSNDYTVEYELDIEIKTILTEHRFYKEKEIITSCDTEEKKVYYGNVFKSLSVYLSNEGLIPNGRLKDFFSSITNGIINPSTATIIANNKNFARKLENTDQLDIIKNNILNGHVLHVDDTGRGTTEILESDLREREDRKVFQACIRTYSNDLNTYLTFNSRKNDDGIKNDNILSLYHGILVHDHESKFRNYGDDGKHADCHSHCNRELKGIFENLKVKFALDLRKFFNDLNQEKKELIKDKINEMSSERLASIDKEFDKIISRGLKEIKPLSEKYGYNDAYNMLIRMTKYKDMYLLFVRDFKASYTNNLAERDLRHATIQEKISGVLRSYEGGKTYTRNMSFISTLKKREINIYKSILSVFNEIPVLEVAK